MFEKDAEEYTVENVCSSCYFEKPCENKCEAFGCADSKTYVLKAFKDGAEFGYNKANEWHYVKDEKDLPTDKKEYLLLLGSGIRTFGFYNGRFWESWKGDFSWQEVKAYFFVPVPELLKESK